MDPGMVSEDNIKFLREGGHRYIIGTPKGMLKKFEQEIHKEDWHAIRDGLEVKIEVALVRMKAGCEKKNRDVQKVERQIGRLLATNSRAAKLFGPRGHPNCTVPCQQSPVERKTKIACFAGRLQNHRLDVLTRNKYHPSDRDKRRSRDASLDVFALPHDGVLFPQRGSSGVKFWAYNGSVCPVCAWHSCLKRRLPLSDVTIMNRSIISIALLTFLSGLALITFPFVDAAPPDSNATHEHNVDR